MTPTLTVGASNSFHLRAHSCLGAELVQIKMGSYRAPQSLQRWGLDFILATHRLAICSASGEPWVSADFPGCVTFLSLLCFFSPLAHILGREWPEPLPRVTCLHLHLSFEQTLHVSGPRNVRLTRPFTPASEWVLPIDEQIGQNGTEIMVYLY